VLRLEEHLHLGARSRWMLPDVERPQGRSEYDAGREHGAGDAHRIVVGDQSFAHFGCFPTLRWQMVGLEAAAGRGPRRWHLHSAARRCSPARVLDPAHGAGRCGPAAALPARAPLRACDAPIPPGGNVPGVARRPPRAHCRRMADGAEFFRDLYRAHADACRVAGVPAPTPQEWVDLANRQIREALSAADDDEVR